MRTKQIVIAGIMSTCMWFTSFAQEEQKKDGQFQGKAILQTFGNFHAGFSDVKDNRGFELERAYVGYQTKVTEQLELKSVLDIGKSSAVDDYQRIAYIKNAQLTWKKKNLTIAGGLIGTTQFNKQEKFWGYRYIDKSFQDKYKFGSSADLGLSLTYQFTDWFSADAIIVNGEGYKKTQVKDGLLYGLGASFNPIKGLELRVYGDINETTIDSLKNTMNLALFVGYKADHFSLGAEYNSNANTKFAPNKNLSGYSCYGKVSVGKLTELYARYDFLTSNNHWSVGSEESSVLLGAQFKLGKYMKLAPNFRVTMPKADGKETMYMAYVNYYFSL